MGALAAREFQAATGRFVGDANGSFAALLSQAGFAFPLRLAACLAAEFWLRAFREGGRLWELRRIKPPPLLLSGTAEDIQTTFIWVALGMLWSFRDKCLAAYILTYSRVAL